MNARHAGVLRAHLRRHLPHPPARGPLQIVIFGTVLRGDDEAELVTVIYLPLNECLAVRPIVLTRVELTAFTIAVDAVALAVTTMPAGTAQPLCFFDPPALPLHHYASVATVGAPIAAHKLPARHNPPRDAAPPHKIAVP